MGEMTMIGRERQSWRLEVQLTKTPHFSIAVIPISPISSPSPLLLIIPSPLPFTSSIVDRTSGDHGN
jgi:hypothetical protein